MNALSWSVTCHYIFLLGLTCTRKDFRNLNFSTVSYRCYKKKLNLKWNTYALNIAYLKRVPFLTNNLPVELTFLCEVRFKQTSLYIVNCYLCIDTLIWRTPCTQPYFKIFNGLNLRMTCNIVEALYNCLLQQACFALVFGTHLYKYEIRIFCR